MWPEPAIRDTPATLSASPPLGPQSVPCLRDAIREASCDWLRCYLSSAIASRAMQAFAGSIREQRDQVKLADESTAIHCAELKDYKVRASAREDQLLYQRCRRIHSGPGCSRPRTAGCSSSSTPSASGTTSTQSSSMGWPGRLSARVVHLPPQPLHLPPQPLQPVLSIRV